MSQAMLATVRLVVENAYLRATLQPVGVRVDSLSLAERAQYLEPYQEPIRADLEFLSATFDHHSLVSAARNLDSRILDESDDPVVLDSAEGGQP